MATFYPLFLQAQKRLGSEKLSNMATTDKRLCYYVQEEMGDVTEDTSKYYTFCGWSHIIISNVKEM